MTQWYNTCCAAEFNLQFYDRGGQAWGNGSVGKVLTEFGSLACLSTACTIIPVVGKRRKADSSAHRPVCPDKNNSDSVRDSFKHKGGQ